MSNDFGVMQTVFFAFTCKFGLCLHVQNKTNWHPLLLQVFQINNLTNRR